jgi:hypothetical protein
VRELWPAGVGIALGVGVIALILSCTVPSPTPPSIIDTLNNMTGDEFKVLTPEERQKLLLQLPSYATVREAGIAGIKRAYQCSAVYECGGVIAQRPDGRFVLGPSRTDYSGDEVEIPRGVPQGWTFAGDFHTHPCHPKSHADRDFSKDDLQYTGVAHYMGELCNGRVHEWVPIAAERYAQEDVQGEQLTEGDVVATIDVLPLDVDAHPGL